MTIDLKLIKLGYKFVELDIFESIVCNFNLISYGEYHVSKLLFQLPMVVVKIYNQTNP